MPKLYTIGFTQKNAERFFGLLSDAGVRTLIDTRLNNKSQLAGFSKSSDLPYFLATISRIGYRHAPEMAPTQDILDEFKKRKGSWPEYEKRFLALLEDRQLAQRVTWSELDSACLLCSEHSPVHCHRRLVAEYFKKHKPSIEIVHLK